MVRKCEWECSEDLIEAGCGDILHMQGVASLPKARNYQIGTGIQIQQKHSLASRLL